MRTAVERSDRRGIVGDRSLERRRSDSLRDMHDEASLTGARVYERKWRCSCARAGDERIHGKGKIITKANCMHRKVDGEGKGERWNGGKVTGQGERRACYASIRAHICRPRSSESVPWKMRVRWSDGGRVPRSLGTEVANTQDVPGVPSSHDPGGEVPARSLPPKGDAVALGR